MQKYNILELNEKLLPELQSIAEELGIKKVSSLKKEELVYRILSYSFSFYEECKCTRFPAEYNQLDKLVYKL